MLAMLMLMLHAAKFTNGNTLALHLQLLLADRITLACFKAFGGVFMCLRHDPMTRNVIFGGFVQFNGQCY